MTERRAIIMGSGVHLAVASALLADRGDVMVIDLENDISEDRRFGLLSGPMDFLFEPGPLFDEPALLRAARRLSEPAPRPQYRNRFLNPVERDPGVEYVFTEAPLTKRQRRRQKGKKK